MLSKNGGNHLDMGFRLESIPDVSWCFLEAFLLLFFFGDSLGASQRKDFPSRPLNACPCHQVGVSNSLNPQDGEGGPASKRVIAWMSGQNPRAFLIR